MQWEQHQKFHWSLTKRIVQYIQETWLWFDSLSTEEQRLSYIWRFIITLFKSCSKEMRWRWSCTTQEKTTDFFIKVLGPNNLLKFGDEHLYPIWPWKESNRNLLSITYILYMYFIKLELELRIITVKMLHVIKRINQVLIKLW